MDRVPRLGWSVSELAEAFGVSRSKGYEIVAEHPELTFRVGHSIRVVPERAREFRDRQLTPLPVIQIDTDPDKASR